MIDRIQTHLLDLLQADNRLFQGGAAYAQGWLGVTRPAKDLPEQPGYVNLFDESHEPASVMQRPGIYLGTRGMESVDRLNLPTISSGGYRELRLLIVPLVVAVAVQGEGKSIAKSQRNQLLSNVRQILYSHMHESGYWYELLIGASGGGQSQIRTSVSATGGGTAGIADAIGILPVEIKYSYTLGSPA